VSQLIKSKKESSVHFVKVSRREKTNGQDLVERICEIQPVVRYGREARTIR
jgi:hypothetical protein